MKKPYLIAILCVAVSVALMIWGFRSPQPAAMGVSPRYALVLTEDKGTYVMQLKQGAQTAAAELGVELELYTTEQGASVDEQILHWFVAWETDPPTAILLPPCDEQTMRRAAELAKRWKAPLVQLGQVNEAADASVRFDPMEQGRLLGEALAARGDSIPLRIYTDGTALASARLAGLHQALNKDERIEVVEGETIDGLAPLKSHRVAVTGALTAQLWRWEMLRDAMPAGVLWGFDPGDERAECLRYGCGGLLVDMPYALGYQAVMVARGCVSGDRFAEPVYAPSRVVTPETMYLTENIKLMFPLLQ